MNVHPKKFNTATVPYLLDILLSNVLSGGVNVAEALVSKGLATVVRYSADNDQRSSRFTSFLYPPCTRGSE